MKNKLKALAFVSSAILCGTALILAAEKTGKDYPNEKCDRQEKDGTTTTGQCSNVCKDLPVSTTKDVNTGHRTCKAARGAAPGWVLVVPTAGNLSTAGNPPPAGNPSVLFWRYNSEGEVQTCVTTSKPDEIECRDVTIRMIEEKSGR